MACSSRKTYLRTFRGSSRSRDSRRRLRKSLLDRRNAAPQVGCLRSVVALRAHDLGIPAAGVVAHLAELPVVERQPLLERSQRRIEIDALRGGDLVVKGSVGARTGVDQKGGTIIVGGNGGMNVAFMMQRGRQIYCGDVGPGLGDSMYSGSIYVAGKVASLGIDCVEGEFGPADQEMIDRKFGIYGLDKPDSFRKFVCGQQLWNYDQLEPNERKLVL